MRSTKTTAVPAVIRDFVNHGSHNWNSSKKLLNEVIFRFSSRPLIRRSPEHEVNFPSRPPESQGQESRERRNVTDQESQTKRNDKKGRTEKARDRQERRNVTDQEGPHCNAVCRSFAAQPDFCRADIRRKCVTAAAPGDRYRVQSPPLPPIRPSIVALGRGYVARFNLQVIVCPAVHCCSDRPVGAYRTRAAVVVEDIARIPVNDIAGPEVYVSTVIGNVREVGICFEVS